VIAAAFLPLRAEATPVAIALRAYPSPAYAVVDQLLSHREQLSLDQRQMTALRELSRRLGEIHGAPRIAGLDRVPGKSVPRFTQASPSRDQAVRSALALLTSGQRLEAIRLLHLSDRPEVLK